MISIPISGCIVQESLFLFDIHAYIWLYCAGAEEPVPVRYSCLYLAVLCRCRRACSIFMLIIWLYCAGAGEPVPVRYLCLYLVVLCRCRRACSCSIFMLIIWLYCAGAGEPVPVRYSCQYLVVLCRCRKACSMFILISGCIVQVLESLFLFDIYAYIWMYCAGAGEPVPIR